MNNSRTTIEVNVLGTTVFIQSKDFNFSYTPASDIVKEEFRGDYQYFGGLQHNYSEESAKALEENLVNIAESFLKILKK